MAGWIKVHRDLMGHWCASDPNFLAVWLRLISEANFKDSQSLINGCVVNVMRGQLVYGRNAFSARCGVPVAKLRRVISTLEREGMISQQKTNKYTIISITKYDDYQVDDQQKTIKRPSNDHQTTTLEEGKESKEGKKAPQKSAPVSIDGFLRRCKESGDQPIPEDDKVFEYAEDAGIPVDLLRLCWLEFVEQMQGKGKRYKDWRAAFRNYVRNNYLKLWFIDNGQYLLTTQGKQAQIKHRGKL